MRNSEARRIVKAAVKAGLIPKPVPTGPDETDTLFRARHAEYMRTWREKWKTIIEARQLKFL